MTKPSSLRWWLLLGVWLLYSAFGLVAASLAPLVSVVEAELNISHTRMGSIMGAWQLVYIFAAIPCGLLLDRLGARWALLLGVLLIAASAFARSVAEDYWGLLFAVMLFGLGGPIISSGAPKVITTLFEGSNRGFAMGVYMTGPALGGVVALTLTHSVLLPLFDGNWRALLQLWAALAVGFGLVWLLLSSIASSRGLHAGEQQGAEHTPQTAAENRLAAPETQKTGLRDLLRIPAVPLVLCMSVGVFLYNHGLNNWLPELLRAGGKSVVAAGNWAALPTVVGILGSLLIPRLATPQRRFHILFWLCIAAALASLLLQTSSNLSLAVGLLLQGIARSSMMTVLILTLVELPGIGQQRAGAASGLFFSAAEVGGVMGPLGLGAMYELTGGFSAGLYALTAVTVALALMVLRLRRLAEGQTRTPG